MSAWATDGRAGGRRTQKRLARDGRYNATNGQVAQSVEQWTENPRVGGSIPPLATKLNNHLPQLLTLSEFSLREFCVTQLAESRRSTTNSGRPSLRSHTLFAASISRDNSAPE